MSYPPLAGSRIYVWWLTLECRIYAPLLVHENSTACEDDSTIGDAVAMVVLQLLDKATDTPHYPYIDQGIPCLG
jgi:hypothetical protein